MITEQEFYSVAARHPNINAAFDETVENLIDMHREFARPGERPGLWAKVRLAARFVGHARSVAAIITMYGIATNCRRPASDVDCLEKIIRAAGENPERKFKMIIAAALNVRL